MKDDDQTRRDRLLLAKASTTAVVADVLDQRSKHDHARSRLRKASRARAMWPSFMRRLIGGPKQVQNSQDVIPLREPRIVRSVPSRSPLLFGIFSFTILGLRPHGAHFTRFSTFEARTVHDRFLH
jgi:hypothetical protein